MSRQLEILWIIGEKIFRKEKIMRIVFKDAQPRVISGIHEYPVYRECDTREVNIDKFFGLFAKWTDKQMTNVDFVREGFYKFISSELEAKC